MRSHRTGLLGLVTGAISGPQAGGGASGLPDLQIVRAIERTLAEAGMSLLISDMGGAAERIPPLVRTLREHRVEGTFYVADHHQRIVIPPPHGPARWSRSMPSTQPEPPAWCPTTIGASMTSWRC